MRAKEFVTEATLSPRDFYKKDRLEKLIQRLEQGLEFIDDKTQKKITINASRAEISGLKNILSYYDATGNMKKDAMTRLMPNTIGGVPLSSIFKDSELGGKGGVKGADDTSAFDVTKFNIGPALEAWKSIAIFAKLTHRADTPVTMADLMSVKSELESTMTLEKKEGSNVETAVTRKLVSVPDMHGSVKDTISIKIDIGLGPFQRAMKVGPQDPNLWGRIQGILTFVNENRALQRYSKIFATNGRVDPIKVAVVGGAGKKTDVRTSYLDPETDYKKGKQIVGMSFSLKAGNAGVSQSSGTTEEGVRTMFRSLGLSNELADQAIIDSKYKPKSAGESETKYKSRLLALTRIFQTAATNLDNSLKTIDNNGEKVFIKKFLDELKNAVTAGEGLIFVEFNPKGTYDYLNPHTLSDLVNYVDLESRMIKRTTPYLYIYDKNSGRNIAHIRLEVQGSGRLILKYELDDLIPLAREAHQKHAKPIAQPGAGVTSAPAVAPQPATPPQQGPNTNTIQGTTMKSTVPASIQNFNKSLSQSKIPMGSSPT